MSASVSVHNAVRVEFEHRTLDPGAPTEFRMLDFHVFDKDGTEILEVKVFDDYGTHRCEPIALRPMKVDD